MHSRRLSLIFRKIVKIKSVFCYFDLHSRRFLFLMERVTVVKS